MSNFWENFDAEQEDEPGFDPLPNGEYRVMTVNAETKTTRKGDGEYLAITFEVVEGQFQGRKLWANFNISNPNEQAVAIARRELASLCRAIGVLRPQGPEALLQKVCVVKVSTEEYQGQARNKVLAYKASNGVSTKPAPAVAAAAGNNDSVPPWKRQ